MAEKKFSDLTTASQINETDIAAISQENNGVWGSFKATIGAIGQKIITGINFTSAFNTNAKTVAGAVNEKLTSNAVADIEVSPAESAHSEGDYLIYNGLLYLVIDDIAIGDALTTGAGGNIEIAQIADGIGGAGHDILNDAGSTLPKEGKLQFVGVYVHDDSTNAKTVVEVVREFQTESAITSLTGEEAKGFQAIINGNSYEPFKATDIGFNKTGTSFTSDDVDGVLREVNSSVNALNKIWHIGQMVSGTPLTIQCNNFHAILLFGLFQEAGSKFLIVSRSSDTVAVKDVVSGSDFSNAKYTFSVSGSNVVITTTSSAQTTLMWARTEGLL